MLSIFGVSLVHQKSQSNFEVLWRGQYLIYRNNSLKAGKTKLLNRTIFVKFEINFKIY